jgi:hypothetical protein
VTVAQGWRSVDPQLHWYERPGEPEVLAFSPRSGSVHLLSSAARPLLTQLDKSPRTLSEIASLLQLAEPEAAAAVVESLDEAGLVEPAP